MARISLRLFFAAAAMLAWGNAPAVADEDLPFLGTWDCEVATFTSIPDVPPNFDLVVTDFDLGREASGADCIAHVRALSGRNVPAIIMTGHDVRRVQEQLGDEEIPILSKPVQPAELRSLLVALKLKSLAA